MPHPVDVAVGQRCKTLRIAAELSQKEIAAKLGISFQQVQKYETGANRISASRLHQIAGIVKVPVAELFADVKQPARAGTPSLRAMAIARQIDSLPAEQRKSVATLVDGLAAEPRRRQTRGAPGGT